eukprot:1811556-Rhodomonas_salina.1
MHFALCRTSAQPRSVERALIWPPSQIKCVLQPAVVQCSGAVPKGFNLAVCCSPRRSCSPARSAWYAYAYLHISLRKYAYIPTRIFISAYAYLCTTVCAYLRACRRVSSHLPTRISIALPPRIFIPRLLPPTALGQNRHHAFLQSVNPY